MGLAIDDHKHCNLAFGTYVEVHEEIDNMLKLWVDSSYPIHPDFKKSNGDLYDQAVCAPHHVNKN